MIHHKAPTLAGGAGDSIHDVAYDHYGKRLATCHSSHVIKVWSEVFASQTKETEWSQDGDPLEGHKGAVWKVDWAHPEYGQVLASCGQDPQIIIWEEREDETGLKWHKVASLKDGREQVNGIRFAPKQYGLCLATCSDDGFIRLFSADDVMNLDSWTLTDKFSTTGAALSLAWNQSRFDPQMMAVGTEKQLQLWVKNETNRRWETTCVVNMNNAVHSVSWASNLGRSYHLIAAAMSQSETVMVWKLLWDETKSSYSNIEQDAALECQTEVWSCEFNVTGNVLATSGDDGKVSLWRKYPTQIWNRIAQEHI